MRSPPGAAERCDDADADEDCDGLSDDADDDATELLSWYVDADGDGFGDPDSAMVESCDDSSGLVSDGTDLDDTDPDGGRLVGVDEAWATLPWDWGVGEHLQVLDDLDGDGLPELLSGGDGYQSYFMESFPLGSVGIWDSDADGGEGEVRHIALGTRRDYGYDITALDDLDGDGLAEFAFSSTYHYYKRYYSDSYTETYSDSRYLLILMGGAPPDETSYGLYSCTSGSSSCTSGTSVARAPDLSGDGVRDVSLSGVVVDGASLGAGASETLATWSCSNLMRADDMDGDGVEEIVCSYDSIYVFGADAEDGSADTLASLSLSVGHRIDGSADLGDVDGDGYTDLAFVADSWTSDAGTVGGAFILPGGLDGALTEDDVPILEGASADETLGAVLGPPGDLDGDGTLEIAISGDRDGEPGAWVFSGPWSGTHRTDELSAFYETEEDVLSFADRPVDRDGDGRDDLALSAGAWKSVEYLSDYYYCSFCYAYKATLYVFPWD